MVGENESDLVEVEQGILKRVENPRFIWRDNERLKEYWNELWEDNTPTSEQIERFCEDRCVEYIPSCRF